MFCANCGAQVPDGTKFCPSCGKPCSTGEKVKQAAEDVFNKSEQELGNAFEDVKQNFQGGTGSTPPPYSGGSVLHRDVHKQMHKPLEKDYPCESSVQRHQNVPRLLKQCSLEYPLLQDTSLHKALAAANDSNNDFE